MSLVWTHRLTLAVASQGDKYSGIFGSVSIDTQHKCHIISGQHKKYKNLQSHPNAYHPIVTSSDMQQTFHVETMHPTRASVLINDEQVGSNFEEHTTSNKTVDVTIALLVPVMDGKKKTKKCKTIQKEFTFSLFDTDELANPLAFWTLALTVLGSSYSNRYVTNNVTGQWPKFKWRKGKAS